MKNSAVIGGFCGDEAKARVVHWMAKDYKYTIRWAGSSNAGHTIYHNGQKIVRHLLPSADFSVPNQHAVLASGMVINPDELLQEVNETEAMFPGSAKRIIVDPDAFVYHRQEKVLLKLLRPVFLQKLRLNALMGLFLLNKENLR